VGEGEVGSITISILNKGIKNRPENFRGTHLLCSTLKLYTKIISKYLTNNLEFENKEQEFRRGQPYPDAIFMLKQITEKPTEFNALLLLSCRPDKA
jgi:hypothetical protein